MRAASSRIRCSPILRSDAAGAVRNWTGIHWWSDAAASMVIGEEVAIALLRDERMTIREPFGGFSLARFDGTRVTA